MEAHTRIASFDTLSEECCSNDRWRDRCAGIVSHHELSLSRWEKKIVREYVLITC